MDHCRAVHWPAQQRSIIPASRSQLQRHSLPRLQPRLLQRPTGCSLAREAANQRSVVRVLHQYRHSMGVCWHQLPVAHVHGWVVPADERAKRLGHVPCDAGFAQLGQHCEHAHSKRSLVIPVLQQRDDWRDLAELQVLPGSSSEPATQPLPYGWLVRISVRQWPQHHYGLRAQIQHAVPPVGRARSQRWLWTYCVGVAARCSR
mmetsp:Transcript_128686/g.181505  ORF Transcript_128686/g.181505 Transcript_128686/m.181505 type:complete len:203 (+) Transcript_128686:340-948(+)